MDDLPTEVTLKDIENFIANLMTSEIKKKTCWKCSNEFSSYLFE